MSNGPGAVQGYDLQFYLRVELTSPLGLGGVDGFDQDERRRERDDGCEVSPGLFAA